MRVLYLSYDGLTDPLGQSQILPYLIGLAAKGIQIDIISFEKPVAFKLLGQEITAVCSEHNLGYFPLRYRKNPPVFSTLFDVWSMKKKAFSLHRKNDYQVVHCRSYIASLTGLWLKQKTGLRFIFDMRGFYADERVDGNLWPQSSWIYTCVYKFFKKKEKEFLVEADRVVSLTHAAKDEILKWDLVSSNDQIAVIPCCTDLSLFDPETVQNSGINHLKTELNLEGCYPVVGYIGSTGTWYLLEDMLLYFKLLRQQFPSAVFLILTFDHPQTIYQNAEFMEIPSTALRVKSVHRKLLPQYMSLFDWSVFFIQPMFSKKASSPTKQGELMSMGIPVLCNTGVGDTREIVEKYDAGLCIEDTSEKSLREAVNNSEALISPKRNKIKSGAKEYFSLQNGVESYYRIYMEVVQ